jgi:hypothetical protein
MILDVGFFRNGIDMSLAIVSYVNKCSKQVVGSGKFRVGDMVRFNRGGLREVISNEEGMKSGAPHNAVNLSHGYIFLRNTNGYIQYNHESHYTLTGVEYE